MMGWTLVANLTAAKALLLRNPDVGLGAGVSCWMAVCTNASMAAQVSALMESLWSSAKQALTPQPAAVSATALSRPGETRPEVGGRAAGPAVNGWKSASRHSVQHAQRVCYTLTETWCGNGGMCPEIMTFR